MEKEKEIRSLQNEIRASKDSRTVEGYAAVFNVESLDLGGFREIINPNAFDGVIPESDVFARFNHDANKILARSNHGKGSLELSIDDKGLKYRFEAPDTETGNELLAFLRNGDINESSFAFTVENDSWVKDSMGNYIRTINKVARLYDVAPVWNAAYGSATSVSCRSFEEFKEKEAEELRKAQEAEQAEAEARAQEEEALKQQRLAEYYSHLHEEYDKIIKGE